MLLYNVADRDVDVSRSTAISPTVSSGSEVLTARIVRLTISSLTPQYSAMIFASATNRSDPKTSIDNPIPKRREWPESGKAGRPNSAPGSLQRSDRLSFIPFFASHDQHVVEHPQARMPPQRGRR